MVDCVVLLVAATGFNALMKFLCILWYLPDMKTFLQGEKILTVYLQHIIGGF